jgi:drug/metabolite transporter (DMT)-like permease
MPVLRSVAFRFLIAGVVLLFVMKLRREPWPRLDQWPMLVGFSMLTIIVPFCITAWASSRISSGLTSILFSASPLIALLFELILFAPQQRPRLSRTLILGLFAGLLGIVLVVKSANASALQITGVIGIILVVVIGSCTSVIALKYLRHLPPLTISTCLTVCAAILVGSASAFVDRGKPTQWTINTICSILFLGLFSSALGFVLFYWLLHKVRPYQLASRYFLMPVVAISEGIVFLNETISPSLVFGTLLILGSLVPILHQEKPRGAIALEESQG